MLPPQPSTQPPPIPSSPSAMPSTQATGRVTVVLVLTYEDEKAAGLSTLAGARAHTVEYRKLHRIVLADVHAVCHCAPTPKAANIRVDSAGKVAVWWDHNPQSSVSTTAFITKLSKISSAPEQADTEAMLSKSIKKACFVVEPESDLSPEVLVQFKPVSPSAVPLEGLGFKRKAGEHDLSPRQTKKQRRRADRFLASFAHAYEQGGNTESKYTVTATLIYTSEKVLSLLARWCTDAAPVRDIVEADMAALGILLKPLTTQIFMRHDGMVYVWWHILSGMSKSVKNEIKKLHAFEAPKKGSKERAMLARLSIECITTKSVAGVATPVDMGCVSRADSTAGSPQIALGTPGSSKPTASKADPNRTSISVTNGSMHKPTAMPMTPMKPKSHSLASGPSVAPLVMGATAKASAPPPPHVGEFDTDHLQLKIKELQAECHRLNIECCAKQSRIKEIEFGRSGTLTWLNKLEANEARATAKAEEELNRRLLLQARVKELKAANTELEALLEERVEKNRGMHSDVGELVKSYKSERANIDQAHVELGEQRAKMEEERAGLERERLRMQEERSALNKERVEMESARVRAAKSHHDIEDGLRARIRELEEKHAAVKVKVEPGIETAPPPSAEQVKKESTEATMRDPWAIFKDLSNAIEAGLAS